MSSPHPSRPASRASDATPPLHTLKTEDIHDDGGYIAPFADVDDGDIINFNKPSMKADVPAAMYRPAVIIAVPTLLDHISSVVSSAWENMTKPKGKRSTVGTIRAVLLAMAAVIAFPVTAVLAFRSYNAEVTRVKGINAISEAKHTHEASRVAPDYSRNKPVNAKSVQFASAEYRAAHTIETRSERDAAKKAAQQAKKALKR